MKTFETSREISAPVDHIFTAFTDPIRLARWWGPAGFTNEFKTCEFKTGGRWSFTMIGPNKAKYPNESQFVEIQAPHKVVIQHLSEPRYLLTIQLTPSAKGAVVSWSQTFEKEDVARRIEHIVVPSNEQNLDRLNAEVLSPAR
jgi:uncharacterized protein YndB with AHSA1/START domain